MFTGRGQNVRFPVFPRNLTFTEGNQQTCLLSRSGKCQNNVNFPILVREIEINCLFPLVVIQNTTENLTSFRNVVPYRKSVKQKIKKQYMAFYNYLLCVENGSREWLVSHQKPDVACEGNAL